jgi:peptidoglycan-associated lipoprotein
MVGLLTQACATQSGSGTGEARTSQEERIGEPAIKEILPQDSGMSTTRRSPATSAQSITRNASALATGSLMDVLFDFDRDSIRMDALPVLESNARLLEANGVSRVLLEGRGDEVGSAAYNIVLGERRARNVRTYLQQLGLSINLTMTSYGKDRPLCFEHTSACMRQNRSVRFVVKE